MLVTLATITIVSVVLIPATVEFTRYARDARRPRSVLGLSGQYAKSALRIDPGMSVAGMSASMSMA